MDHNPPVSTKPWAIYCDMFPIGIGLVVKDNGPLLDILYSERQVFPAECWEAKHVKRFDTYQQAIDFYLTIADGSKERLTELVQRDFSKTLVGTPPAPSSPLCTASINLDTKLTPLNPEEEYKLFQKGIAHFSGQTPTAQVSNYWSDFNPLDPHTNQTQKSQTNETPRMRELRESAEAGVRSWQEIPVEQRAAILTRAHYQATKYSVDKGRAQADTAGSDITRFHG